MKHRVSSLPEAAEALIAVGEFLQQLSASLGVPIKSDATTQQSVNGTIPQGMSQQVIHILSNSARPMMPKEIVNRHQDLGWPAPIGGRKKLYEAVAGSLSYLLNRKGLLTKTRRGYLIKQDEQK